MYHVGDTIYLLLLQHEKLPPQCYLGEKEDGTGRRGGAVVYRCTFLFCCHVPSLLLSPRPAMHAVGFIASHHLEDVSVLGLVA